MAKSKASTNQMFSFVIIGITVLTFVFFFLKMFNATTLGGDFTFFDFFDVRKTIDKIFAVVGLIIVIWDVIDNCMTLFFPKWRDLGKLRGFLQVITGIAWIGIMLYYLITYIDFVAYGAVVLMILAVLSGVIKLLAAKDSVK